MNFAFVLRAQSAVIIYYKDSHHFEMVERRQDGLQLADGLHYFVARQRVAAVQQVHHLVFEPSFHSAPDWRGAGGLITVGPAVWTEDAPETGDLTVELRNKKCIDKNLEKNQRKPVGERERKILIFPWCRRTQRFRLRCGLYGADGVR